MNKNIIVTVHSIKDEASGVSQSVVGLYEEIYKQNHNLLLLNCDYAGDKAPCFSKSFPSNKYPKKLGRSPEMYNWMKQQASKGEIQIIHNHGLWMMSNVYSGWIAKKYNIPLITSPHGMLSSIAMNHGSKIKKLFWPLIQYPAIKHSVCFHATALSEYNDIRRMGFKQPVAIIPFGIDLNNFKPQSSLAKSKYKTLLFLGRIHPIKGLDILLKVWQKLQNVFLDWQLNIVGPDNYNYLVELSKLVQNLNLERINFVGPLFGDAKLQAYTNANLFILPSYSENFAMGIAEALALGVPVITTKGTPWQILEEVNAGLWVDSNEDSIKNGLSKLMSLSTAELKIMGANGHKLIKDNYSMGKIAEMMSELYHWVLNGGTCPNFVKLD